MAWSSHKDQENIKEHFSDGKTLDRQASELAELIKKSRHFVVFTGAGISTSAGIPDFRGPEGVWTMRAQGKRAVAKTSTIKAFPTAGHMALVSLEEAGILKFLISQNTDGLHRRSGFRPEKLVELHGNTNLEVCRTCGKQFLRDFRCRQKKMKNTKKSVHDHSTDRKCSCGGTLYDSIINFGESLPVKALEDGFLQAEKADLILVLGSSLTVTPAADMPRRVAERNKTLVICNLQKTPLDSASQIRVFAKTDELMTRVLSKLEVKEKKWKLIRHLTVEWKQKKHTDDYQIIVSGVEADGTHASILSAVEFDISGTGLKAKALKETEPFLTNFKMKQDNKLSVSLVLSFMGHYNEPSLNLH